METAGGGAVIGEKIKDIGFHKPDVLNAIKPAVSASRGEGGGAGIDSLDG